jgi:protein-disulfide isomerase
VLIINSDGEIFPISGAQPYESIKVVVDDALAAIDGKKNKGATSTAQNVRPVDDTDHVQGPAVAPITMIEYSDFECPFCERVHPTLKRVTAEYKDKVRWVYRNFPLVQIHSEAHSAAVAAECAAEIGGNNAFWSMADLLFQNQQQLGKVLYLQNAAALKL